MPLARILSAYGRPLGIPLSILLSATIVLVCLGLHVVFLGIDWSILTHMVVLGFPLVCIWFSEPVAGFAGGSVHGRQLAPSHPLAVQMGGWLFLLAIAATEIYVYLTG